MATYTTSLKLTQPGNGEYAGTWGTVVNDQVTALIDEAIAGSVTINTWPGVGNTHTMVISNGLPSEGRKAYIVTTSTPADSILECPSIVKTYVVRNTSSYQVTVKTGAGSGVAVPAGQTMTLQCDGTDVRQPNTTLYNISLYGNTVVPNGTANGVGYLNGSKVFTTDNNLTFDGNNLKAKAYKETGIALGGTTVIDLNTGNYFSKTITGDTTFSVTNVPASGTVVSFILDLKDGGIALTAFWSGIKWASGTQPPLSNNGRDILGFFTTVNSDGTYSWVGLMIAKDVR